LIENNRKQLIDYKLCRMTQNSCEIQGKQNGKKLYTFLIN